MVVGLKCKLQVTVADHCFTITETTQTFTKMLTLGLVISKLLWFMISSLSDYFKVLAPLKPIVARACTFSRALCRLRVITSSFDWFTGKSPSFLIG